MQLEHFAEKVFNEILNEAVKEVIVKHAGSAIETDLKTAIKERAKYLLENDKEIRELLRANIIKWIKQES